MQEQGDIENPRKPAFSSMPLNHPVLIIIIIPFFCKESTFLKKILLKLQT